MQKREMPRLIFLFCSHMPYTQITVIYLKLKVNGYISAKATPLFSVVHLVSVRVNFERKRFLAYRIRISACFTWTDNSYLTHVISPGAG